MQRDRGDRLPKECLAELEILFRRELAQDSVALARDLHGNLIRHLGCRCSRPRRISEDMQVREWKRLDESATLFEQLICLTGKADHHVSSDCCILHSRSNLADAFLVVPRTIFA